MEKMEREELQQSLEGLRSEIRKLGEDDEAIKDRMRNLMADLERQLDDDEDYDEPEQLIESMRDHIERFEVEHPRLTGMLNRVMVALSNLGI